LNFEAVLRAVSGFLEEREARFAVIGGVALAALGLPRTTVDLDFIVDSSIQDELIGFLESRGYETLHRSSGYSNHRHADLAVWGKVDFVYVKGRTSQEIFASARPAQGPGGFRILVPKPEHLAALKVQAIKNDPERALQDLADVRFLLTLPGVDRYEIRDYFDRQGLGDRFDEIEKT
jgi:hypothetical protein